MIRTPALLVALLAPTLARDLETATEPAVDLTNRSTQEIDPTGAPAAGELQGRPVERAPEAEGAGQQSRLAFGSEVQPDEVGFARTPLITDEAPRNAEDHGPAPGPVAERAPPPPHGIHSLAQRRAQRRARRWTGREPLLG